MKIPLIGSAEAHDKITSVEHWRDFVRAHPWPLLVALLSVLWLLLLVQWPTSTSTAPAALEKFELVGPDAVAEVVLDAKHRADLPAGDVITAKHISVNGSVTLTGSRIIVADEIEFAPNARIAVPSGQLTVIASRVIHGVLDVSGAHGRAGHPPGGAGQDGDDGGVVFVAAAQFTDVLVTADGGAGGDGQRGYTGAAGANGYCGPRGFGLAQRGRAGGDGGDAGNGGSAGLVTIWYAADAPHVHADEGRPGNAGRGGPGGRGGDGCKGVRGTQRAQSAGNEGDAGRPGANGQPGTTSTRRVDFSDVVDAYEEWLDHHAAPEALRDRLRMLPTISR